MAELNDVDMSGIRCINEEERELLIEFYKRKYRHNHEEAVDIVDGYKHFVRTDYMSDGPGYVDDIIFAWYGFVTCFKMFLYREDGTLEEANIEC